MSMQLDTDAGPVDLTKARMAATMLGGDHYEELRLMPGDVVKAERQYGIRATDGVAFEHVLYMVWMAAKRRGYGGEFEAFIETLEGLDVRSGAETGNPISPAP